MLSPYEQPAHQRWVEQGHCPSIHHTKAWCNGRAGHREDHHAPYVDRDGKPIRHRFWTAAEEYR